METGGTNEAKLLRCWETNYKLPDQTQKATIQTPLNTQLLLSKFFQWKFAHFQQNSEQFDVTLVHIINEINELRKMNSIKDLLSVKGMVLCIFSQRCDTVQSPERFSFQCTEDFNTHFSGALVKNQYFFPLSKINYFKWPLRIAKKCTWLLKVKRITWPSKMSRKSPRDST